MTGCVASAPGGSAGHRHKITQPLLRRLAGRDAEAPSWTLLGCGSLGSKIGLHLTRAGCAPAAVVDKGVMSPHNAARHALLPPTGDLQLAWTDAKARLLAKAIGGCGAEATPLIADAVDLCATVGGARQAWSRGTWAVVNTTGSLNVREALAAAGDRVPPRVIECSLLSSGRIGLLTVEGADRNPDTGDLISLAYRLMKDDPIVASVVYGPGTSSRREITGKAAAP